MRKLYSTTYTDEYLTREDNVRDRDGELFCKFRGVETLTPYYFKQEFVENYIIEVGAA